MRLAGWMAAAYLAGSISFSYLIVRRRTGTDVRTTGSGNAGATNVMRSAGRGAAAATLVADLLKGAVPVWLAGAFGCSTFETAWVGLAAVVGHVFPVFLGFRGGKGVATAAGAYLALCPAALGIALGVFAAVVAATRMVSAGSLAAALAFAPAWLGAGRLEWAARPEARVLLVVLGITALVVWTHRGNLVRLVRGTERRLGSADT